MATIRKRGNYQWEVQIRKRGFPSQSKTFNTKAEADAWARMIESEMSRASGLAVARLNQPPYLKSWHATRKKLFLARKGLCKSTP